MLVPTRGKAHLAEGNFDGGRRDSVVLRLCLKRTLGSLSFLLPNPLICLQKASSKRVVFEGSVANRVIRFRQRTSQAVEQRDRWRTAIASGAPRV